jgi:subtilisin family serine protease
MRTAFRSRAFFLATLLAFPFPRTAGADPRRELIVFLAPSRTAAREAFSLRLASLGLTTLARLDQGLARRGGATLFGLDPRHVLLVAAADSASAARARVTLAGDPAVERVEPNEPRSIALRALAPRRENRAPSDMAALPPDFPNDPLFRDGRQWALRNLGPAGPGGGVAGADVRALEAWRATVGSNDVLLAIADTGVDPLQPELAAALADRRSRVLPGINVSTDSTATTDDLAGHGTLVAGVMAARTHDGAHSDSLGIAGVCGGDGGANLGCRLLPIKITRGHETVTGSFEIARAILAAAQSGARAVNVSFAGAGPSGLERRALYQAMVHGCVAVCASGNDGWRDGPAARYPAAYAADGLAIQVGSSDAWDHRSVWSSFGPGLDLVAPGEEIWTTWMSHPSWNGTDYPGYVVASGTSLAAPHATGAVGLLAAARPELRDTGLQMVLRASAHDLGAPGADAETGTGRLDLAAALATVSPSLGLWSDEVAGEPFGEPVIDTLVVPDPASLPLAPWTGRVLAERIEVHATVTWPDSFLAAGAGDAAALRVWPRIGGTTTVRGEFRLPYLTPHAEVIARDARGFTLRGYVYREVAAAGEPLELPVPADLARFGFTVLGPVARAIAAVPARASEARTLRARPNPFRGSASIEPPGPGRLSILDVQGRVVRRADVRGTIAPFVWDGRDDLGRPLPPGLYLLRHEGDDATRFAKLVRLD